ncbi:MAG: hypothetical protein WB609_02335 [Candidatus Cybelea sp.]
MTLRKVPGALVLGLLASLAAHAALFGREHAMGGDYHALLVEAALGGALCLLAFFGALAWNGSKGTADGSIVAARLQGRLPGAGALFASTLLWYVVAEAIEPHHSPAGTLAAGVALAAAAWLLSRLARAFVAIVAGAVIAVRRTHFSPRTFFWQLRPARRPLLRRASLVRRRYARPPPVAVLIRA